MSKFKDDFEEANKVVHKVEDEWHYPILKKYGWIPKTLTGVGFVRSYEYEHPDRLNVIKMTTGFNADYWSDSISGGGYHGTLEQHLEALDGIMKE